MIQYSLLIPFQASKETLSDIYNDITLENAQIAAHSTLVNAQNAAAAAQDTITQGVDTTITISMPEDLNIVHIDIHLFNYLTAKVTLQFQVKF